MKWIASILFQKVLFGVVALVMYSTWGCIFTRRYGHIAGYGGSIVLYNDSGGSAVIEPIVVAFLKQILCCRWSVGEMPCLVRSNDMLQGRELCNGI